MKCTYRNCKEDVLMGEGPKLRSNKKYCSEKCRRNKEKYRHRASKKLKENG